MMLNVTQDSFPKPWFCFTFQELNKVIRLNDFHFNV
jgi:hypothetical protein